MNLKEIKRAVAKVTGVSVGTLDGPARHDSAAFARQIGMAIACEQVLIAYGRLTAVGKGFNRTRTNVHYAVTQVKNRCATCAQSRALVAAVRRELAGQTFNHGDGI